MNSDDTKDITKDNQALEELVKSFREYNEVLNEVKREIDIARKKYEIDNME